MADEGGGGWVMGLVLTIIAVAGGVILAGYIGGAIAAKQSTTTASG
jgi:energy-converting hydrogenase Eha subunit G